MKEKIRSVVFNFILFTIFYLSAILTGYGISYVIIERLWYSLLWALVGSAATLIAGYTHAAIVRKLCTKYNSKQNDHKE